MFIIERDLNGYSPLQRFNPQRVSGSFEIPALES
jgi:hypothetical protein